MDIATQMETTGCRRNKEFAKYNQMENDHKHNQGLKRKVSPPKETQLIWTQPVGGKIYE